MHIGILNQILELVLLVVGVYGDAYGSYLGACIEECEPVGHVLSPQANVAAFGDAYRNQAAGHIVNPFVELLPGKTQVAVRIYNVFLIGSNLSPMLKPVSKCSF